MNLEEPDSKRPAGSLPGSAGAVVTPLIDRAWAEWDLIQKKIDSVSTFPFTVKAWSVTLAGALLAFGKGAEFPKWLLFGSLIVPLIFKAVESKHNAIRDTLSRRGELLEQLIERLTPLKDQLPPGFPREWRQALDRVPGVALSLIRASNKAASAKVVFTSAEAWISWQSLATGINVVWQKYFARYSDAVFYTGQIVLMLVFITGLTFCESSKSPTGSYVANNNITSVVVKARESGTTSFNSTPESKKQLSHQPRASHHCRWHRHWKDSTADIPADQQ
jgi:hypothetical protein